jgi:hypothetical protein
MLKSLNTQVFLSTLLVTFSFQIFAGNGVERGRVLMPLDSHVKQEVTSFLSKQVSICSKNFEEDTFHVTHFDLKKDEVDQGIVDHYYKFDLLQINNIGEEINEISIEIEDTDYSNWKVYEEKLSIQFLKDKNKLCN